MPETGRFLIVTWDGGGNVQPALGLGRLLAGRGHAVQVLGWSVAPERVEAAGCAFISFLTSVRVDPSLGRAWEDQSDEMFEELTCGMEGAEEVLAEVERVRPDVLVVDFFLSGCMSAAEATALPSVGFVHVQRGFYDFPETDDPDNWGWDFDPLNATRRRLGLAPIERDGGRVRVQMLERCSRVFAALPREFDRPDLPVSANLRHVGPIFEEATGSWVPPEDDGQPLVVVAFSSTYMHHEAVLGRVLAALDGLQARTLVTLGGGLEPHEVPPGPWVVREYVPHREALPYAALVVTHAGMGTVNAALAFGVPMLCLPMGRDQFLNAERVEALGAGRTISADASAEEMREAILGALGSDELRAGSRRMAEICAAYGRGSVAVDELEGLLQ